MLQRVMFDWNAIKLRSYDSCMGMGIMGTMRISRQSTGWKQMSQEATEWKEMPRDSSGNEREMYKRRRILL